MTVAELIKFLQTQDQNLTVLFCRHSDYQMLEQDEIEVGKAVDKGHYVMRTHPAMSEENKSKVKDYLIFPGN